MFTFSFGSAFAAIQAGDAPDTISDGWFKTLWTDLVKVTSGTDGDVVKLGYQGGDYAIDKSIVAGMEADAKVIYDAYMNDATDYVTVQDDFKGIIFGTKSGLKASIQDKADAFCLALAKAQFTADKTEALANLDTVPFYNYSTEVMSKTAAKLAEDLTKENVSNADGTQTVVTKVEFVDKDFTYKQAAEKLVEYFKGVVEDYDDFDADVTVKEYADASKNIADYVADGYAANVSNAVVLPLGYKAANTVSLTGGYDIVALYSTCATGVDANNKDVKYFDVNNSVNNWSAKAVASNDKTDAATTAAVKAMNAAKYAAESVNADADKIKYLDKWLKVADILAEEGYSYEGSKLIQAPNYSTKLYEKRANWMSELEDYAARYGAEKNADGKLIRDAADVQKYLKDGLAAIATAGTNADAENEMKTAMTKIYNAVSKDLADVLAFVKESAKKDIELKIADYEADEVYYPAELAKIKEYAATYNAKIDAATTETAAEDAHKEFGIKVSKVKTAGDLSAEWTAKMLAASTPTTAVDNIYKAAASYVDYYNRSVASEDSAKLVDDTLKDRIADLIGNSEARTDKEIKALKDEAVKVAAALPTQDAVKTAAKALKTALEALPAKATVADLATIQAASDAIKAYKELVGADLAEGEKTTTDISAYNVALTQLVAAYNSQFAQEVAKVSDTDEAAIKTIKSDITTAVDAIKALYEQREGDNKAKCNYMNTLKSTLNTYLGKIKDNDAKAVEDAIKAIPINVTDADKATVEKARQLYDEYVAKYNDYEHLYDKEDGCTAPYTHGYAADDFGTLLGNLTAAETVLGLNAVSPAELVKGLKITAKSTAKKGSITVKWAVKGEADIDGYEIWKSTKANKGYKKAFTTTKKTYKNSKGLKKGTRYYYKVRAYKVIDGVKVTSDWSNKARRVAK